MRRLLAVLALGSLAGCGILGCDAERRVIEIRWGSVTEDFDQFALERSRTEGFDCTYDGAIRNAAGGEVGERWTCEKC